MNSKYLSVINSLLIVTIAIVLIFQLSSSTKSTATNEDSVQLKNNEASAVALEDLSKSATVNANIDFSNLKIAFVNSDTVSTHYQFAKDVQAALLKKQSSAENQIKNKYREYEKMVGEYQQSAKIMGQSEAQEKGQQIALLEQEIMSLEQSLNQKLSAEEMKITSDYVIQTNTYMQVIGKQLGYDYVMSYRLGGPMLYANPNFDITNQVIELLNIEYKAK
jgi:outer membrane protein